MIIGLLGFISSGKGTVGDILKNDFSFQQDSFARPLKDMLSSVFGWPRHLLEGDTKESRIWRDQVDVWWAEKLQIPEFSPRFAMQHIGTDVLRHYFNDSLWVMSLERRILNMGNANIVVTDCRFPNEIDLLVKMGGIPVRVKRGIDPIWYDLALEYNMKMREYQKTNKVAWDSMVGVWDCPPIHISEWAWIGYDIKHTISNEGTFDDLRQTTTHFVNHRNSISQFVG